MTGVALRPAAKQLVAGLFLRRELPFAREYCVVFRSELHDFGRRFVAGDRLCHLIKSDTGPAAVKRTKLNGRRSAGRRRPRPRADQFHIARPGEREGLLSPYAFESGAVGSL